MANLSGCRVCKNTNTQLLFDLGMQPPANSLLQSADEQEDSYPLALVRCPNCALIQLNYTVDPQKLFSHYLWVTGTSKTTRDFSETFAKELITRTPSSQNGYVLDVGSNDGTFLVPFANQGFQVLGVDPAQNIVDIANTNGVPTICRFFGAQAAQEIVQEHGQAKMVFARNVLPHVANTQDFVQGLADTLAEDGVLAVEVHYAKSIMEGLQYDSIYHEHLCYFTLQPLEQLLSQFGLHVFDVLQGPLSGGALIVYARKQKDDESPQLKEFRKKEEYEKINMLEPWKNFAKQCLDHRDAFAAMLQKAAKEEQYIAGYGSSARSSTLLNFCGTKSRAIQAIIDQSPLKQGLYTAGTHIRIDSPEKIMAKNPTLLVILAWNFADEIIDNLKETYHYNQKVLVPLPNKPVIKYV